MARPSKLTDEAIGRFLQAIAVGSFPEVAARFAGFSPRSLYRFMKGSTPPHAAFRDRVLQAETELELRLTGTIVKAGMTDPRWAEALLARRFPERWGRRSSTDQTDEGRGSAAQRSGTEVSLDPALVEAIVPRLLEAGARLRDPSEGSDPVERFRVGPRRSTEPPEDDR